MKRGKLEVKVLLCPNEEKKRKEKKKALTGCSWVPETYKNTRAIEVGNKGLGF